MNKEEFKERLNKICEEYSFSNNISVDRIKAATYRGIDIQLLYDLYSLDIPVKYDDLLKECLKQRERIEELEKIERKFNLLEAYGVDNWPGYSFAMNEYWDKYGEE